MSEGPRVLVVDGDIGQAEALASILRAEGYSASAAQAGPGADKRLAAVLDAVSNPVLIVDACHSIQFANKATRDVLGEVTGEKCHKVFAGLAQPCEDCPLCPILEEGKESVVCRVLGRRREVHASRLQDRDGADCVITIASHATEERLRERLVQMERLSAVGEIVSGVAHELSNPLAAVVGFSQLVRNESSPARIRRHLERIELSAKRCHRIVRNLLSFARKPTPERVLIHLAELLHGVREMLSYEAATQDVKIKERYARDLPPVEGDAHLLRQAFFNVVLTGFQAISGARRPGVVTLRTARSRRGVKVEITDSGPGIAPENVPRVFDAFFTTKPEGQGTGLGLSMARTAVENCEGSIRVESELGKGATFVIELPASREKTRRPPEPVEGLRALVVDGEETILSMMRGMLGSLGHSCDTADNLDAARKKLAARPYDAVFVDLRMPGIDGALLAQKAIRMYPYLTGRVVIMTGDVLSREATEAAGAAGGHLLVKPFDLSGLAGAIGELRGPGGVH